ncbi:MAG TPA: ABC transporter substrate-binding protein [Stellaceae bacterium]|nr:ABC transporter substrate-binding protein [Stellaceae bacterium]
MQNRVGVLAVAVVAVIAIIGIYMYTRSPTPPAPVPQQAAAPAAPAPAPAAPAAQPAPAPPAAQPAAAPAPAAAGPAPQPAAAPAITPLPAAAPATVAPAGSTETAFTCPKTGGDLVFGGEAKVNSLDMNSSNTISTRNNAMNMFESLMTRDENYNPIPELADSMEESPDHLTYTFKLRQGVKFHNGKDLTTDDVMASFDRYAKLGIERGNLANVDKWEAPDKYTFVIRMKKAQPTFIEDLSSFSNPIVIYPSEQKDAEALRLVPIGTGPFQLVEYVADSHVKMKRYDGYKPNTNFKQRTGFGGYKVACVDTVTYRIVTEPGARVAGLETGELMAVEDVPTKAQAQLKTNKDVVLLPLENFWIHIMLPNTSFPPTDNLAFRKAVQAALDMDEIMDAATDGAYKLNVGFQYPGRAFYTDAGKETYNIKNKELAKKYLQEAGYNGEPLILLTNQDYTSMYNAALVVSEQLKAVGINAKLDVVDWPTSVNRQLKERTGWNFFFTGYGTQPALGALATAKFFVPPQTVFYPKNDVPDPDLVRLYGDMLGKPDVADRKAAFADLQKTVLDRVYAVPFGSLTKVQGTRANVKGFVPFRIPRFANVWIE